MKSIVQLYNHRDEIVIINEVQKIITKRLFMIPDGTWVKWFGVIYVIKRKDNKICLMHNIARAGSPVTFGMGCQMIIEVLEK